MPVIKCSNGKYRIGTGSCISHKDSEGKLMTGKTHNEGSEYLYHKDNLKYKKPY